MKTVVFVVYSMNIGGVEKSLLGVINKFVSEGWDVNVAMLSISGGFMPYLPKCVKIHKIKGYELIKPITQNPPRRTIKNFLKCGHIFSAIRHLYYYLNLKLTHTSIKLYLHEFRKIPQFSEQEFDLAVAFAGPDSFIDLYVTTKIKAKEKWGWIHFDITRFGTDYGITSYCGQHYNRINVVSAEGKQIFDTRFPELCIKTYMEPNIINVDFIREMSKVHVKKPVCTGKKIILTVGRVSIEKGQMIVLQSIKQLIDCGRKNIIYWMVGDGHDTCRCKEFVRKNGLDDYVYFFGSLVNPYPYMALCDLYVQPSLHEGFCITLAEVRVFGKPIITTNFTGAKEQLKDYPYHHKIVEISSSAITRAIAECL